MSAVVPSEREDEFLSGYRTLNASAKPDGLLRSELLRGQTGRWLIQTLWRDRAAMTASRQAGQPPPALALFDQVGAEHSHEVFSVAESYEA